MNRLFRFKANAKFKHKRSVWRSLRFRLIALYVVLVGITLLIFSVYFYFQLQQHEQSQVDANLQAAALQVIPTLSLDSGTPQFRRSPNPRENAATNLREKGYLIRLTGPDGHLIDSTGAFAQDIPTNFPLTGGYFTIPSEDNSTNWRIYNQRLELHNQGDGGHDQLVGWIQVGWPAFLAYDALADVYTPLLLAIPLVLLLAGLGGWFLASQVLRPLTRVTRTAQAISSTDLAGRIGSSSSSSTNEIERLAITFDSMLDRLQAAFERERRFTADASHELRTPLTALKGRIEVSLGRPRSQVEYVDTLGDLNTDVDRLIRLTNALLILSRIDQNHLDWPREKLNLSDLLDSIIETMQPLAEAKTIALQAQLVPGLTIIGNFDQLTRLFMNLLDNALKYTPSEGKVIVRLEERGQSACIEVADNGPGIAAEHLPRLFERFYRAQPDRASSSGGAGLGLAIAYEITRWHNGNIKVESKLTEGTVIAVHLPLL